MSKVVIGLSGGVDSAVSAYLLQKQGHEVIGVYVDMLSEKYGFSRTVDDAQKVAEQLGIVFYLVDGKERFEEMVIRPFIDDYYNGFTPSPCLRCNRYIKFGLMAEFAQSIGADYLATGHYAGLRNGDDGTTKLVCGEDKKKDQSYFLYGIEKKWLDKIIFPLASYSKDEIRAIAQEIGLEVADKPESQEICFVANNDYKTFLEQYSGKKSIKGDFVDATGEKLGEHNGIENYTIGQRKGLGIALGKPVYVVEIDKKNHRVVLGDNDDLFHGVLLAKENNFLKEVAIGESIAVLAKVRYRAEKAEAILTRIDEDKAKVVFQIAQRAITPGQGVCYYVGDEVLGGGTIAEVMDKHE